MKKAAIGLLALIFTVNTAITYAEEAEGAGSMISGPLIRVWAEAYGMYSPGAKIKYQGSNPADGIKKISEKEVEFSSIDMPLGIDKLKKQNLLQFPIALGAVAPVVNLPNVYPGQLRLDGQTFGDILLGVITNWSDPAIAALNPTMKLPNAKIIVIHRASPPGISTIVGDFLAKTHTTWQSIKGDGMAGDWPAGSIEVKNPIENIDTIKVTQYAIGYGPVPHIMKNKLSYVQMKNKAGKYVSPSDDNVTAAAENASWDEENGFAVVLTDQPGVNSWPLSMAAFALMQKVAVNPEKSRETLKYFKYSLRHGGLKAIQNDFIPLPDSVRSKVYASWNSIVDKSGASLIRN